MRHWWDGSCGWRETPGRPLRPFVHPAEIDAADLKYAAQALLRGFSDAARETVHIMARLKAGQSRR